MDKRLIYITLGLLLSVVMYSQNNTSSPYSRFGYGELNDNVACVYRGMGGIGTGMRSRQVINPSQPASYSAVDTTSFMMDLGASLVWSRYGDALGTRNKWNGNLEYLTLQFPLWRWIGFSVGVMPYSMVGYNLQESDTTVVHPNIRVHSGKGGIIDVYGGISFNIMNWVAIGANVYYMFGEIENSRSVSFTESGFQGLQMDERLHVSDIRLRYGVQLFHGFGDHDIVLGAVYEPRKRLRGDFSRIETSTADTVETVGEGFELPEHWSVGASYSWSNRLTIGVDYTETGWSGIKYFGDRGVFNDRRRLGVGMEYRHNMYGKRYVERMPFRFGINLANSYLGILSEPDLGVSVGVGFPLRNVATLINTTLEYGHRGSYGGVGMQENYLRLTVSAGINENWFFKRKL